ncbi:uncharacterized protein LOC143299544 isoform X2 [Babylonia areolata]|uniref:uncharacterized protein LOC143299544 isoform X2 n=1 Tax=Babylonia areolata TaxID=304850 RepID=UPI003FD44DC6
MCEGLFTFCAMLIWFFTATQATQVDQNTYEDGRKQFELIQHQSELPHYGQCWKDAVILMQSGCKRLTDNVQGRLALAYLNCFLDLQGRRKYECDQDDTLETCTKTLEDADRASFTTFFTHTQNICYFLRAQVWNEMTEKTISVLAESSSHVAAQLQKSSHLQTKIMEQQNDSLQNQKILIENAANLTNTLSSSSTEINRLFQSFKETTQEQRLLITDVFDQLASLKQTVLGEFSGFYSILYYFFSVLVSYLLTSTTRTGGARFWLFSIVTVSIFCEYFITSWSPYFLEWTSLQLQDHDDWMYWIRNSCRKLFAVTGLIVLAVFAYTYHDINAANNQLLVEIRKQNSDLKRLLHGSQLMSVEAQPNGFAGGDRSMALECSTSHSDTETSDSDAEDSSSDRTYILQETGSSLADTDSYFTADTIHGSSASALTKASLMEELRDLRSTTPLKEMRGQMERWITTGGYSQLSSNGAVPAMSSSSDMNRKPLGSPYSLRPRRGRVSGSPTPAIQVESPRSFGRTVRQLERIAEKNSRMVRAAVSGKAANR